MMSTLFPRPVGSIIPGYSILHNVPDYPAGRNDAVDDSPAQINWQPDYEVYINRPATAASQAPKGALMRGWPKMLVSALVWKGQDFQSEEEYIYNLGDDEKREIKNALRHFKSLHLERSLVSKKTFPLGSLGPVLERLTVELHRGKGFFVIRGLEPALLSVEENALVYLGISSYVASRRGRAGSTPQVITQILQPPKGLSEELRRQPIYTNHGQPFYTDVVFDVLPLYTCSAPAMGGDNFIASSWHVYNVLAITRPNILETLAASDWGHNMFDLAGSYFKRPLLFLNKNDQPVFNFSRRAITGNEQFPRSKASSPITNRQAEALDAFHFIADQNKLRLGSRAGDMRFVNNFAVLHSRGPFEDSEQSKRHVMRMWLRNDELAWDVPEGIRKDWERTYEQNEDVTARQDLSKSFAQLGGSGKCS